MTGLGRLRRYHYPLASWPCPRMDILRHRILVKPVSGEPWSFRYGHWDQSGPMSGLDIDPIPTARYSTTKDRRHRHRHGNNDDDDDNNHLDPLMINIGIQDALRQPREVLFATTGWTSSTINQIPQGTQRQGRTTTTTTTTTWIVAPSAFLAVPMDQDDELRKELAALHYGLPNSWGMNGTNGLVDIPGTPRGW